jgi:hypothetical protein
MAKMICENPPIERNSLNVRTINALIRAGYARVENQRFPGDYRNYKGLEIDWNKIRENETSLWVIRNLGDKSIVRIKEWMESAGEQVITKRFERCENCKFHYDEDDMECRRFPPQKTERYSFFPTVSPDSWCGEFRSPKL